MWDRAYGDDPIEAFAPAPLLRDKNSFPSSSFGPAAIRDTFTNNHGASIASIESLAPAPPLRDEGSFPSSSFGPTAIRDIFSNNHGASIESLAPALEAALREMAAGAAANTPAAPANTSTSDISISVDNFREFSTRYLFLDHDHLVFHAREGTLLARRFGRELVTSSDHGTSWTFLHMFSRPIMAIYVDDALNIFVSTSANRWDPEGSGEVFKSSDGGNSFRKVLDIGAGVPLNWNISSRGAHIFISEYGYKGDSGNNARRIYRSLDRGENWEIVFEPEAMAEWHNHKILITRAGVIYQSIGDGENARIISSIDNGDSWSLAVPGFHPTSGVEFENHILWGLDGGHKPGVIRYDKESGVITQSLHLPPPFNGPAYGMVMANGVVYAIFISYEGYSHPASIFYSSDEGESWNLLGYIEKPSSAYGIGLYNLVADERFAYINIQTPIYINETLEHFRGTLRFELIS